MEHEITVTPFHKRAGVKREVLHTRRRKNDPRAGSTLSEILFITSYPPRECGIATYSQDLIKVLGSKFDQSFDIGICALESETEQHAYSEEVQYKLRTDDPAAFVPLAREINGNAAIRLVVIQHEFGFFHKTEESLVNFLRELQIPTIIVFHTVLPNPSEALKSHVRRLSTLSESVVAMTHFSEVLLIDDYEVPAEKIAVIPHGTHLVTYADKRHLKSRYNVSGRKILSTFGLLSSGKNIETTLRALPDIVKRNPDVLFLIIGKTHPSVVKQEGEKYREMLGKMVVDLQLQDHVRFINYFLPLRDLLKYLQLTDVYLFTSNDPNQAVSGTFSYAISCGCPIVSTPIPHAREVLKNDLGMIIDFGDDRQLSKAVTRLLSDESLRNQISSNGLHRMASTAWENAAIDHARLFERAHATTTPLSYTIPPLNLDHIKRLTTDFGMIQFSRINRPDISSGYTLDDNARAMVAMCQHYETTGEIEDAEYVVRYFNFISHCQQPGGDFLNYVDEHKLFTEQNGMVNLADANGRAIWALGHLTSISERLPDEFRGVGEDAERVLQRALPHLKNIQSTRAMGFAIKGLYYRDKRYRNDENTALITELTNRLVQMYRHESGEGWSWFESYLTYANSVLPEAVLCAWSVTGEPVYKEIAVSSFDFLLSKIFTDDGIRVISNKDWMKKGAAVVSAAGGEQPIDVAYTILALGRFYDVFGDDEYHAKMTTAFNWFLGDNHLRQIIYNPSTGGCYDGLEEDYVNLNQGAESTVSYLMARLTVGKS